MVRIPADITAYTPPSLSRLRRMLALQSFWFQPQVFGLEHLDAGRPALYVGNHTLFGVIDSPLMVLETYAKTGIFFRSLGDHLHFDIPGWGDRLLEFGAVPGTPENCTALMKAGAHIIVYPGGAREVMKNKGEEYRLVWKRRTGFARMAMMNGYDIIPFAAVGADDVYKIHYDSNSFQRSLLGKAANASGLLHKFWRDGDIFAPITSGLAGTPIPRPEKMYFQFGPRIPTRHLQAAWNNPDAQWQVRHDVEAAIYDQLDALFKIRAADTDWPWWRRKLIARKGQD